MRLIDNPFYILDVATTDDRKTIISKAEEKSFFENSSACSEAQNVLLNIVKRTFAELSWFPGASKAKVEEICNAIANQRPITYSGLTSVAKLNACIYNFGIQVHADVYEIGYAVLEIDGLFGDLNVSEITSTINNDRSIAAIKEISESEVSAELEKVRQYIKRTITEKVQNLSDDQYAEFATLIAEKCISDASYDDGIVIDDIINQYELWVQPILEDHENEIRYIIKTTEADIQNEFNKQDAGDGKFLETSLKIRVQINVDTILQKLKLWDVYAQPLQLRDTARGYAHNDSRSLAMDIRGFAVFLYNEKEYTELAIKITEVLRSVFAELPEFLDKINEDHQQLNKLKKMEDSLAQVQEMNRFMANMQPKSKYQRQLDFRKNISWIAAIVIIICLLCAGISDCSSV